MQNANEVVITDKQSGGLDAGRLIGGLALLIPALLLYITVQLVPLFNTISASYTDVNFPGRPGEFVGTANFERLAEDRVLVQAITYTIAMVTVRIVVVATVPLVIGLLVGGQGFSGRSTNRLLMTLIAVLASPIAIAILYRAFLAPIWGREPSPLQFAQPPLASPDTAPQTLIQLDVLITVGIAMAVGGAAFIAVMRGRRVSHSAGRAGIGVWLLGILLAAASFPQTLDLAFTLTGGGPVNSTLTFGLKLYNDSFRNFRLGYAAAEIVTALPGLVVIGILIWLVVTFLRLRLRFTPAPERAEGAGVYGILSLPLIILLGLPILGLVLWGVWLVVSNNGFAELGDRLNIPQALTNTMASPWLAIWFVQLPLTYLLGLSLGFIRPLGRLGSDILFLIFILLAIIPPEFLGVQWFLSLAEAEAVNTSLGLSMGFLVNLFSLLIFKLFFDGTYESYQAARANGQTTSDAFLNTVLLPSLPIFLLVGAVLSFASAQNLFWPFIALNERDLLPLVPQLLIISGQFATDFPTVVAAALALIVPFGLLFMIIFGLLQVLVVDRLAILAGPSVDVTVEKRKPASEDDAVIGFGG